MKYKKQSFVICFLLFLVSSTSAQITFQKTYGGAGFEDFTSVQQTDDGGYIMLGAESSFSSGSSDIYLVKTDSVGDTTWTKSFGGAYQDIGHYVQQTSDGGYILTGITNSVGPLSGIAFLIKTDSNGDTLWTKYYWAGLGSTGLSVVQTFDGGYILDCVADLTSQLLLIKTDSVGDTLWTKSYGMFVDFGGSIRQTADSGFIVIGSQGSISFYDIYLLKTDKIGNRIWKKTYGGNSNDYGYSVEQTPDGGYILVGYQVVLNGEIYLIKTDSTGDTLWTKGYGGNKIFQGLCVQRTNDAGYIIGGATQIIGTGPSDGLLIKTDSIGDTLWTKEFGGINNDGISPVQQTDDGGYILAGSTESYGLGLSEAYLIKTDSMGNSGCNENGTATILRTPTTIISSSTSADTAIVIYTSVGAFSLAEGKGGITTMLCIDVGMKEAIEESLISIYPNPTKNFFIADIHEEFFKAELEIHNVLGEKIYSAKLSHAREVIDCTKFVSGIYFIAVKVENKILVKKLIVSK